MPPKAARLTEERRDEIHKHLDLIQFPEDIEQGSLWRSIPSPGVTPLVYSSLALSRLPTQQRL